MVNFEWDSGKELFNIHKHKVDFWTARSVFQDPNRHIYKDSKHGMTEERYHCVGKVGDHILTVRFVYRGERIRIIGAGYWRKGKKLYEKRKKG